MKEYAQAEKEERRTADTLDRRGVCVPSAKGDLHRSVADAKLICYLAGHQTHLGVQRA